MDYHTLIALAEAFEDVASTATREIMGVKVGSVRDQSADIMHMQADAFRLAAEKIKPADPTGPYPG